jgi:hypothetical protein
MISAKVILRDLELGKPIKICFTEKEFNKGLPPDARKMTDLYIDNAGYMTFDPPRLFIRRDNCLIHSIEAVAHELVHFKYPELRHGKTFDKIVETVLHAKIPRLKKAKRSK